VIKETTPEKGIHVAYTCIHQGYDAMDDGSLGISRQGWF